MAGPEQESDRFLDEEFGRYRALRALGSGGFGGVYVAADPGLGREVALKVLTRLSSQASQRFEREALTLARLRHPNIIRVHEIGEAHGRPFLVMDLIDGDPLSEHASPGALLPPARAAALIAEVARAVAYAHGEGVLHRDLKPGNIVVERGTGRPYVLDFGLAFLADEGLAERLTVSGAPLGTHGYMAPEQASGGTPDERTDVYGLGATLYELVCGRRPLEGSPDPPLVALARHDPVDPREHEPGIPPELSRVILRCLRKSPDDRYPDALALADALEACAAAGGERRPAQRGGLGVALALLLSLLFLTVGLGAWWSERRSRRPVDPAVERAVERRLSLARTLACQRAQPRLVRAELEEAVRQAGPEPRLLVAARLEEADYLVTVGLRAEALGVVEPLLEVEGEAGYRARFLRAKALSEASDPRGDGVPAYEALARDDPDGVYGLLAGAELLMETDPARAGEQAARAGQLDPQLVAAMLTRAYALSAEQRFSEALRQVQRALEVKPYDPRVHLALASVRVNGGDAAGALRAVNEAIAVWGDRVHPLTIGFRGKILSYLDEGERARGEIDRALSGLEGVDRGDLLTWRGVLAWRAGDREVALASWREAEALDPAALRAVWSRPFPPETRRVLFEALEEAQ